jgi:ABC-2 type transport system permease protein
MRWGSGKRASVAEAATWRSSAGASALDLEIVRGPRFWWRSYVQTLKWGLLSLRLMLPMMVVLQVLMGAGFAVGLGFLFSDITPQQALYISTGSSVFPLLLIGFVVVPQEVAQQKLEGSYEYFFTLPVSRLATFLATVSIWILVGMPSIVVALAAADLRYDLGLSVSPWAVPAALLVIGVGTSIGFSMAHAIPNPRATNVISQVLVLVIFMFSPVNFPPERLPGWLSWAHEWLPAGHSATLMRWSLTDGVVDDPARPLITLLAWLAAGVAASYWVVTRRG